MISGNRPILDERSLRARLRRRRVQGRRGIATLWTILFIPVFLLLFIIAVEAGYLWLSRVELENALESAALAAVKEWAETPFTGPGWTLPARQLGVEYAAANTINGVPVDIDLNYDPDKPPNENASCDGDLIFGAITNEDYQCGDLAIFNAGIRPSCGAGEVLIDASGQGNLKTANENEWGIAFHRDENTPAGILIERITIDLGDPADNDAYFRIDGLSPLTISDNTNDKVQCSGGTPSQEDVYGLDRNTQIDWTFSERYFSDTRAKVVTFTFDEDIVSGDPGFEPCDRFRFGLAVVRDDTSDQFDGDDVGLLNVTITIEFNIGPPVTGTLNDTEYKSNECECDPLNPYDDFCTSSLIVHPAGIPDLPCPPGSAAKNDGQSYGLTPGAADRDFAVRAQKTIEVPGLICRFCSLPIGPFSVSACSTAMYDCNDQRPRLVRVEEFICPGPEP